MKKSDKTPRTGRNQKRLMIVSRLLFMIYLGFTLYFYIFTSIVFYFNYSHLFLYILCFFQNGWEEAYVTVIGIIWNPLWRLNGSITFWEAI